MPLAVPNPNPTTPPRSGPKRGGGGSNRPPSTEPPKPTGPSAPGPVFAGTTTPSRGWQGDVRPDWNQGDGIGGLAANAANDALAGFGAPTTRTTVYDSYVGQFGQDAVNRAQASGLDPDVYFNENLTDKARGIIDQWGTNLPNATAIMEEQQAAFDQQQAGYARDDAFIEQQNAFTNSQMAANQSSYNNQTGMATSLYELGLTELNQGFETDMNLLGERRYRDVDLARSNNSADQNYLGNMRGITDSRQGIRGERYADDQNFFGQQHGEIQGQKQTAYDRYMENDAYGAQQAVDNNAQYGFTGRQYDASVSDAFDQRETQNRANLSASAGAGSFGSAGTRDNYSDITGQYGSALNQAGLSMDRQNQQTDEQDRAIGHGRELNNLGYEDTQSAFRGQENSLQHQVNQSGFAYEDDLQGFAATRAGYDRDGTKLANVGKSIDSLANEYGIKAKDIENQFQSAATKMGLDLNDVNRSLEEALNSGNAQQIQAAMNFQYQMMSMQ